jgi:NH3-dependent NAD+ synthetase
VRKFTQRLSSYFSSGKYVPRVREDFNAMFVTETFVSEDAIKRIFSGIKEQVKDDMITQTQEKFNNANVQQRKRNLWAL